ncbi:MAG TPA: cytochrome c3 family protein [Candidatus Brocadiales bacterium]|nr:cytochrome c3 family protein [Candidatus Brocadiales bacterium]
MIRLVSISVLSMLILLTSILSRAPADGIFDDVVSTRHNMGIRKEDACIACHTSGMSNSEIKKEKSNGVVSEKLNTVPSALWIRKAGNSNPEYASSPDSSGREIKPFGPSYDCLSCHDGVLAKDVHGLGGTRAGSEVFEPRLDAQALEGNNPFDHPTSIIYPRRPDGVLDAKNPTVNQFRYWSIPDRDEKGVTMPTGPTSRYFEVPKGADTKDPYIDALQVRTFKGVIHCDSCHNPHTDRNSSFLRVPIRSLCLSCHDR